ncbi:unnamed protein product [Aphanomyces euteiches]
MSDKIDKTTPIKRWFTFEGEGGDIHLWYFDNITFVSQGRKTLMGIWKGYEGDEVKNTYRSLIFDDGDICRSNPDRRYSVIVKLSKKDHSGMSEYMDSYEPSTEPCTFTTKLNFYTTPEKLQLASPDDVIEWFDDPNAPHNLCRDIKCNYTDISAKISTALKKMDNLKIQLKGLKRATNHNNVLSSILESSTTIVSAANEVLLHSMNVYEQLTQFQAKAPPTCPNQPDEDE